MAEKGLGTNAGGGVVKPKPMDRYSPPKATSGKKADTSPKATSHGCCGTQGKH